MTLPVITEGKLLLIGFEDWSPQWHVLPLALVVLAGLWALVKRREWWRHFVRLWCHLTLLLRLHFHTHSLAAVRREWRAIQYVLSFSRCEVGPIWWDRYYSVANIHFLFILSSMHKHPKNDSKNFCWDAQGQRFLYLFDPFFLNIQKWNCREAATSGKNTCFHDEWFLRVLLRWIVK